MYTARSISLFGWSLFMGIFLDSALDPGRVQVPAGDENLPTHPALA
ncbi:Unknown protein sequence [Pseudomonas syringae pv. maculicola]|nr:Unknown protein sequence [Pseudomonas syringae pv. maculicola]